MVFGARKDSLWHEMSGDVKVRRLLGVFFADHWPVAGLVSGGFLFQHSMLPTYRFYRGTIIALT